MTGTNERNIDFNRKYEKEKFIIPGIAYIIGVVISYYGSKGTEEITVLGAIEIGLMKNIDLDLR